MSNVLELTTVDDNVELLKGKPRELPKNDKKMPVFTKDMLPNRLSDYVFGQAEAGKLTASAIAISALTGVSGVLGKKVVLDVGFKEVTANVWGLVAGESGAGKSPCLRTITPIIKDLDTKLEEEHREKLADYNLDIEVIDARIKEIKDSMKSDIKDANHEAIKDKKQLIKEVENSKPYRPIANAIIYTDFTPQAIIDKIAKDCPNGILLCGVEFYKMLQTLSSKENATKQGMFLKAYDGEFDKSLTLGRGTINVDKVSISILADIQTSNLEKYLNQVKDNEGLLARFQLLSVVEDSARTHKKPKLDEKLQNVYKDLIDELFDIPLLDRVINGELVKGEPKKYKYTAKADDFLDRWFKWYDAEVRNFAEDTPMKRYLNKFGETMYKISLIFHVIDKKDEEFVGIDTLEKVVKFMNYLYETAKYLYDDKIDLVVKHAKEILSKPLGRFKDGFTASSLRDTYSSLRNDKQISLTIESLNLLKEHNHILEISPKKRDRYTRYRLME
ncbi:DUF3987 domain-containing protein [Francisella sp. TX07-6608]|uniref:DUF3987 domain-containing protein n=1 Tax=Francisella sp. TX07-6608 TaxID=573568 RepID=UPI0008F9B55D|nr:DUF3987 domain-containing protein [Francisella sp. TX07-6608]OIN84479.1 hypothetical protein KX00_713 [Francisella sp. TX07-6608]